MNNVHQQHALIFKALCDEKRLHILELLRSGEKCACVLIDEMQIGQSALSYHMKILCESQIVKSRQDGKWTHYHIDETGSAKAMQALQEITSSHPQIKTCCHKKSS